MSFRSFYAELSAVFLLLVLALGGCFIAITFTSARYLFASADQLLNREYAGSIASELEPLLSESFSPDRIQGAIHYMMVLNPRVEIYLLDGRGKILAFFAGPSGKVVLESVDLFPVKRFIEGASKGLITGEDPKKPGQRKPFSAAPLTVGGENGYVYIILGGETYDTLLRVARESYLLRVMAVSFLLSLASALAVGLTLFFLLTRRLRSLRDAVHDFRRGELSRRVDERGRDELADLGRSFNGMAAAIGESLEKLRESERIRKELTANISHDLRSPLTSVQAYLETVIRKSGDLDPGERNRYLEICLRNTAEIGRLVDGLLELSLLEAGQVRPVLEPVQIAELVQDVILKLKPRADTARVRLEPELTGGLPMVSADIALIERALSNLFENAVRHSPEGGTVRVLIAPSPDSIRISVADSGPGISDEDLPRIFDRFYRGSGARTDARGNLGLGLAITRQIVELHGGTLEVERRPEGGAVFSFSLPLA